MSLLFSFPFSAAAVVRLLQTSSPTSIVVDDVVYEFDGFLLLAHEDISKVRFSCCCRCVSCNRGDDG